MNKKFFTLIASACLLAASVGTGKAQFVASLPADVGKQYTELNQEHRGVQLAIQLPGDNHLATSLLAMVPDGSGRYKLAAVDGNEDPATPLNQTLWQVKWVQDGSSNQILFTFKNRASGEVLAIDLEDAVKSTAARTQIQVGNTFSQWRWSNITKKGNTIDFAHSPLAASYANGDSVISLVLTTPAATSTGISAVRTKNSDIPEDAITLVPYEANPVVLSPYDLNTRLWTTEIDKTTGEPKIENFSMKFTPEVINNEWKNLFTEQLFVAEGAINTNNHANGGGTYEEEGVADAMRSNKSVKWVRLKVAEEDSKEYLFLDTTFIAEQNVAYNDLKFKFKIDTLNSDKVMEVPGLVTADYIRMMASRAKFQFTLFPSNDSINIKVGNADLKLEATPYWTRGVSGPGEGVGDYSTFEGKPVDFEKPQVMRNGQLVSTINETENQKLVKLYYLTEKTTNSAGHSEVTVGPAEPQRAGMSPPTTIRTKITITEDPLTTRERTTLKDGLYFISLKTARKDKAAENGGYRIVHLNQELMWAKEDASQILGTIQNFGHMPAAQWVVEQVKTPGMEDAEYRVNIYNREYANKGPGELKGIYAKNIQLYKAGEDGEVQALYYSDSDNSAFGAADTLVFTHVSEAKPKVKEAYESEYLGYHYLAPDKLRERVYNLDYLSGIQTGHFLNVLDSETDSLIRVDVGTDNKVGFVLETATNYRDEGVFGYSGALTKGSGKMFQRLKRTAYNIRIKDSNLLIADGKYVVKVPVSHTGEPMYAVSDVSYKGEAAVFFIKENNRLVEDEKGVPFFALIDAHRKPNPLNDKDEWDFKNYADADTLYGENWSQYEPDKPYVRAGIKDGSLLMTQEAQAEKRVAAFAFRPADTYLYRRFDAGKYGPLTEPFGDKTNAPVWLKFPKFNDHAYYLTENSMHREGDKIYRDELNDKTISFLALDNEYHRPELKDTMSYTFYVDTAYVRDSTIMPQYMLALRPTFAEPNIKWCTDDHHKGQEQVIGGEWYNCPHTIKSIQMTKGEWLFNAQDSVNAGNKDYQGKFSYGAKDLTRLAFVHGVHAMDTFYVLRDKDLIVKDAEKISATDLYKIPKVDKHYLGANVHYDPDAPAYTKDDKDGKKSFNEGRRKAMVFQFRLIDEQNRRFLIESTRGEDDMEIGPKTGQWIKIQNGVPVISETIFVGDAQQNSIEIFDVTDKDVDNQAVGNEEAEAASVKVVAGYGEVTVYGAAGKTVSVSNILGQVVAGKALTSDQETIALPKGIVVVAVAGEKAVKAVVK